MNKIIKYNNFIIERRYLKLEEGLINEELTTKEIVMGLGILAGIVLGNVDKVKAQTINKETLDKIENVLDDENKKDSFTKILSDRGMKEEAEVIKNNSTEVLSLLDSDKNELVFDKSKIKSEKSTQWTQNESSIKILGLFIEYINSITDEDVYKLDQLEFVNLIDKLDKDVFSSVSDMSADKRDPIRFFKKSNLQPGSDIMKQYQQDISDNTGITKFKTPDGKEHKFVDGTFGVATVRATINFYIAKNSPFLDYAVKGNRPILKMGDIFKSITSVESEKAPFGKIENPTINIEKQKH
jgi:hypothetical protein